jgi:hypothetical protein
VRRARAIALVGIALLLAQAGAAQQAQIRIARGPHYVGEPVSLRISASGFAEEPLPEIQVEPPREGRLDFLGVAPSVNESISIVNGRMTRSREVTHVFEYRYVASSPGLAVIGPFRLVQGGTQRDVPAVRVTVRDVPASDDIGVALELPEGPVFVGERVPVTLEFTLSRELQPRIQGYSLQVPLFDETEQFQFLDPVERGETDVVIETAKGRVEFGGDASEVERAGRKLLVVSVRRTLVPLRAGALDVPRASLVVNEGTQFRRDLFGQRTATQVRKWRAIDQPRRLLVRPVPEQGRPQSFAGAVGRGFTLEVSADRSVVQVGEPITLTLTLRGEGLEGAALPPLDAPGLLPPDSFRAPSGERPGELVDDAKRFTAVVRVLDERVSEIPALAYSWFDPATQAFETTRSRPIALAVGAALVIGAADVEGTPARGDEGEATRTPASPRSGGLTLTGADLAIERDPDRLLRRHAEGTYGVWLPAGVYAASLLVVALALLERRRADVDPVLRRRRQILAEQRTKLYEAAGLPPQQAAEQIAQALRRMLAELPEHRDPEVDAFLGECDALRYAPSGTSISSGETLHRRGEQLAKRLEEAGS